MKYLLGLVIVLFLCSYCYSSENVDKKNIKSEENNSKLEENTKEQTDKAIVEYTYLGKKISKDQFDRYYKMFNTITIIDGKPYDIGKSIYALKEREKGKLVLASLYMAQGMPAVGTFCESPLPFVEGPDFSYGIGTRRTKIIQTCKVLSVISESEYIIVLNNSSVNNMIFHVTGVKNKLVDNQDFSVRKLICTGSYSYNSAGGGKITVPSWKVYEPLTEKEFLEVLKNGFQLSSYSLKEKKKDKRGIIYQVVATLIK